MEQRKETIDVIYSWQIADESLECNPSVEILNSALSRIGGKANIIVTENGPCLSIELAEGNNNIGRPRASIVEDLTIADIQHARFMDTSMEEIAKRIGISRRTLYRKWNSINGLNLPSDLPYSRWP